MVTFGYLWLFVGFSFPYTGVSKITQRFQILHSGRPATNLLMSADLGWIMVGGLFISCYLWLFVVFALTQEFQKIHSDSRLYTTARPATSLLMSADLGWIPVGGLAISGYL